MSLLESPTLESVSAEFAQWRRHKNPSRTPEKLQRHAVGLLSDYRMGEVLKALRLSHKSLKQWRERWSESVVGELAQAQSESFVALPAIEPRMLPELDPSQKIALKLSCQEPTGKGLAIEASLDEEQWRWALALLNGRAQA